MSFVAGISVCFFYKSYSHIIFTDNHSWSTFDLQLELSYITCETIVYKNSLVTFGKDEYKPYLAFLNLDNLNLETPEEKPMISLLMDEKKSDVAFIVEGQTIPAHKQVLVQKSQYFANLFNSGMIESNQEVIEIPDCEYQVFKEFLRFIYCHQVKFDIDLARKLLLFSEKHVQKDLLEKCIDFLKENINLKTVFTILDFAREQDIPQLQSICLNFCYAQIDMESASELINYLEQQNSQDFEQYNKLRDTALDVLLTWNFIKREKHMIQFYEDFIIRNIELSTIERIVQFISSLKTGTLEQEGAINLEKAALRFVQKNFNEIQDQGIIESFPKNYLIYYAKYVTEKLNQSEEEREKHENSQGNQYEEELDEENNNSIDKAKKGHKRKEPTREESSEENPRLKQTKKSLT